MQDCGPVTLFVYNRCIDLYRKYFEMKDLRSIYKTTIASLTSHSPSKKPESEKLVSSTCFKITVRILEFFDFNFQMAKRDALAQWKVQAWMKKMPTCKELRWIAKNFEV